MPVKPTMLGGFEELVLMAIIKLGNDRAYGVPVRHAVAEAAGRNISVGALYTTLDRLEEKGYVSSYEADATTERGNRVRRYYRVEGSGIEALRTADRARKKIGGLDLIGGLA